VILDFTRSDPESSSHFFKLLTRPQLVTSGHVILPWKVQRRL